MQINSYNSKQNFTGVRLSSNSMTCVKDAVNTLRKTGFDFIGKQIVFCDNTMEAKMTAGQVIRNRTSFHNKRFGAVFFPWSGECYLMADKAAEQKMARILSQYDAKTVVNLVI